jgi:DUF4097 and DUF4098 domain-containing protein YvlB
MSVQRTAGAIFWGLTLMTIGGLLLANNLGYPIRIWPYVVRYWPALLIGWGLLKFVDYYRFRHAGDNRPLFSGGEVALLILVIFAGSAITTAANVSPEIGNIFDIRDIDLWDITGNNFSFDQHVEQSGVVPASPIEIYNYYGDVEVRAGDTDRIVVDVRKTVRASDKAEADRLEQDFTFSVRQEGERYIVKSNRDESGFHGTPRQRFKSSLTIQVPKQSKLHLENRNGRIMIQDLAGNQSIINRYGDVEVRNINGTVTLENRNGGITIEDVTDAVMISNRYSNTTVKNVGGDLQINTRNGSVDVADVKGNATIDNSYAPIHIENVQGDVTVTGRNNSVDIEHVNGDIRADSSYQNVTIKDPRGGVRVTSRNGDLLLSFERPPQKDVSIDSRFANVTVELPSSSAFRIDARTQFGDVDSEFEGLSINRNNREKIINGEYRQGGPQLSISTRNGQIRLQKRG